MDQVKSMVLFSVFLVEKTVKRFSEVAHTIGAI